MRVIAGRLGGRTFDSPNGHRTHPMSEKARGALFNALGDIEGLTLLDAFAGSGAVGIEAISRGAGSVVFVERDVAAVRTIQHNVQLLGIEDMVHVAAQGVTSWSETHASDVFDIVVADPPYDDIRLGPLERLVAHAKADGLFVLSWPGSASVPEFSALTELKTKSLGDIQLVFYRKIR